MAARRVSFSRPFKIATEELNRQKEIDRKIAKDSTGSALQSRIPRYSQKDKPKSDPEKCRERIDQEMGRKKTKKSSAVIERESVVPPQEPLVGESVVLLSESVVSEHDTMHSASVCDAQSETEKVVCEPSVSLPSSLTESEAFTEDEIENNLVDMQSAARVDETESQTLVESETVANTLVESEEEATIIEAEEKIENNKVDIQSAAHVEEIESPALVENEETITVEESRSETPSPAHGTRPPEEVPEVVCDLHDILTDGTATTESESESLSESALWCVVEEAIVEAHTLSDTHAHSAASQRFSPAPASHSTSISQPSLTFPHTHTPHTHTPHKPCTACVVEESERCVERESLTLNAQHAVERVIHTLCALILSLVLCNVSLVQHTTHSASTQRDTPLIEIVRTLWWPLRFVCEALCVALSVSLTVGFLPLRVTEWCVRLWLRIALSVLNEVQDLTRLKSDMTM